MGTIGFRAGQEGERKGLAYLTERVAYLRGLVEGLKGRQDTREGKILLGIIEVLDDITRTIEQMQSAQNEIDKYVESIDQDLADLECEFFGESPEDMLQIECPNCHDIISIETVEGIENNDIICPNCNGLINKQTDLTVN